MKSRIKVITLGVADLEKSLAFYRDGLGLPTKGIIGQEFENGAVVFIEMNDGLILALYPKKSLAGEAGVSVTPTSASDLALGHNVNSKEEVDAVVAKVKELI